MQALRCRPAVAISLLFVLAPTVLYAQLRGDVFVSGLASPLAFLQDPSDPTVQYIAEQGGLVKVVRNGILLPAPFLDLSAAIAAGGERGLLGLAFPDDYGATGRFYVNFTNTAGDTVVARFRRSVSDPYLADPSSRFDLLWSTGERVIRQPFANHNGGHLVFGPDGFLYIGLGDGGSGNDPDHHAQNPASLLGKMLRIDVAVADNDPEGFDVPPDNPFVGSAAPEIWAFGLRNPWRYTFDDPMRGGTGAMLLGDVGQNAWEEINHEPAGSGGRNYGWPNREGAHANGTRPAPAYLPLIDPIFEYGHETGRAVTGGYVYRGAGLGAQYRGRYFFADFVTGRVWSLGLAIGAGGEATAADLVEHTSELSAAVPIGAVSSFGLDASGELYLVSFNGTIIRITDTATQVPVGPPFGHIDTPADGAVVAGEVPLTGWALDDSGIAAVEIYRDPVGLEPVHPNGLVFIGTATLVDGARPDVVAAFPNYPGASRAGWGLMVLSNVLPNGGTGSYVLHAIGRSTTGELHLLGSRRVHGANATSSLPFGTIDTPGQGETVSGIVINFGWALTPLPAVIPTDGSTIEVYVDGVMVGHPVYNNFRSDIAAIFPGLANSNGAVGYFVFDTRALENGLHSIAWFVRDSAGHAQGIGSRFFIVANP